jgi:hypothetical protein
MKHIQRAVWASTYQPHLLRSRAWTIPRNFQWRCQHPEHDYTNPGATLGGPTHAVETGTHKWTFRPPLVGGRMPWERVAKRLAGIKCTGDALKQAMTKRRDLLLAEGHLIPPVLQTNDILSKLVVRGYTRDLTSDDPFTAVSVFWKDVWTSDTGSWLILQQLVSLSRAKDIRAHKYLFSSLPSVTRQLCPYAFHQEGIGLGLKINTRVDV